VSDEDTPVMTSIKNEENRGLAAAVADLVLEARQHTIGLRALYVEICQMQDVVPRLWWVKLIEEQERHVTRSEEQLTGLRTVAV
jgi:hypothetical protein